MTMRSEHFVAAIDRLAPFQDEIRAVYTTFVDSKPVVGWLAMLCEMRRMRRAGATFGTDLFARMEGK